MILGTRRRGISSTCSTWRTRIGGKHGSKEKKDRYQKGDQRTPNKLEFNCSFHDYSSQVPSNYLEAAAHDGSTSPLHDAAKRGDKELIIAIVIVLVVIFLIIAIMVFFDNSISGNMELLKECLLNKMPVNQGDAAGELFFIVGSP